ncbi:MAG: hypothetical protein AAGK04_05135 [Planctomycetota bacterium]
MPPGIQKMPKRQLVLLNPSDDGAMGSLGSPRAFEETVRPFNIAPDGAERKTGTLPLFGPGVVLEIALGQEQLAQALITVIDQDIAWPVLSRLCRELKWKMMDAATGQTFG